MVNRVILDGHCTRDTVRVATQGKPMARMRVATNSVWRDANGDRQETTEYHSIVLFGRTAEVAEQFAVKGRSVYVEGRLRTRDFTDGDGNRRFSTEVIADSVKFLGAARRDEADGVPDTAPEPDPAAPPGGRPRSGLPLVPTVRSGGTPNAGGRGHSHECVHRRSRHHRSPRRRDTDPARTRRPARRAGVHLVDSEPAAPPPDQPARLPPRRRRARPVHAGLARPPALGRERPDPNVDAVDVPAARAHGLRVVCEHCGGGARGDGNRPTYTGCGCTGRIHGRVLEPAR